MYLHRLPFHKVGGRWGWSLALLLLTLVSLAGCFGFGNRSETMTVLAGSELSDLEPLFDQIRRETGVQLEMEYVGTLNGAERLLSGEQVDLAWFSHAKYLTLLQSANSRVVAQEKIMLSPVVMGVKESKARAWGWIDNPNVTWQEIADKAGDGELHFAMTNPAASNSGFTALVGVAAALSGQADALRIEDINNAALQQFFRGQALTAGSSGWLVESYVREQDRLDGMINYESVLLGLNEGNELNEPLYLIYPREGIITADYPLMLINSDKREQYDKLVEFFRSPDFQKTLMDETLRRPVVPQVPLSSLFPTQLLVELPFPNSIDIIDRLLFAYLDEQRIPAHAIFVLDTSGSMEGERLAELKAAMSNLTGEDQTLTGQFSRFRNREIITLMPFNSTVADIREFTIDDTDTQGQTMAEIRDYVDRLESGGDTAIFTSLAAAYSLAKDAKDSDPERYYSIVVMSDGENTAGINLDEFLSYYHTLPGTVQEIPTFTVLFGNADVDEMNAIAENTGGRVFNAQSDSLSTIFKQIRGYQ